MGFPRAEEEETRERRRLNPKPTRGWSTTEKANINIG